MNDAEAQLLNTTEIYRRFRQFGIETFGKEATDTVLPATSPFLPPERKKVHPFWWAVAGAIVAKLLF